MDVFKIVRSRLGQKTVPQSTDHPDPNLLAAFAESSLLERERADVSAHLAACADCREYLALAFSNPEPELNEAAHPQRSSVRHWFRTWRWFVTAAAACCVIGVALQYNVEPPPRPRQARALKGPPAAPNNVEGPSAMQRNLGHQPAVPVLLSKRLRRAKDQGQAAPEEPELPAHQLLPSPRENASKAADETVVAGAPELAAGSIYPSRAEARATAALLPMNTDTLEKPKRALASPRMKLAAADAFVSPAAAKSVAARAVLWSINTSPDSLSRSFGVVQRSFDRGKTWEVISLDDRVSFRAVTASGSEVWAGGSNGSLFHSSDGGLHWTQIAISDEAAKPTGAIVRIDARDPSQLGIATSSGEHWRSTDGGAHWKQD